MIREMLKSKIHRAVITQTELEYMGSITIDIDLTFSDIDGVKTRSLPYLSVIEVKRDRDSSQSDMINLLRKNHIRSMGFSKYCMGTALINRDVKTNLFRTRMRRIGKYEKNFLSA